jgi:hypothetical protein
MAAAMRDGAGGGLGSNPGSNVPIDRQRLYTPRLNTAGQHAIYGNQQGYGDYPTPLQQQQQQPNAITPTRQEVLASGGVDGNYGNARVQTARSQMLGGSAMSNIMSPDHRQPQRGSDPYGDPHGQQQQQQQNNRGYTSEPPSTGRKSQYALELEAQMREKQERDRKAREQDSADGIARSGGGGRQSRVVSNLRNTVQESRGNNQGESPAEDASTVNASRQRMLGGGAMAGMLGASTPPASLPRAITLCCVFAPPPTTTTVAAVAAAAAE